VSDELSRSKYCFLRAEPSTSACTEHDPPFRLKERRARDAAHAKWDAMQKNRLRRRISNLSSDQKTYRVLQCCGLRCNAVFCGGDVSVAETTFIQAFAAGPRVR
jgi:hypothetical protein